MIKINDIDKYLEAERKLREAEIKIDDAIWSLNAPWVGISLQIQGGHPELFNELREECLKELAVMLQGLMPVIRARITQFLDNKRAEIKGKLQNDIEKL